MPIAFVRILDEKGALVAINNTNKWYAYLKIRGTMMGEEIDGEGGRREGGRGRWVDRMHPQWVEMVVVGGREAIWISITLDQQYILRGTNKTKQHVAR